MLRHTLCPLVWAMVAVLVLATTVSYAQAPDSISFQGRLTDSGGSLINASGLPVTFAMYKDGIKVWEETQNLEVENGLFNVLLGSVTPLDTVKFNVPIELGIKVDEDLEISPRVPLASAAYAKALPGLYTFYRDDGSNHGYNVVGGANNNRVGAGVTGATISGGGGAPNGLSNAGNIASADFAAVGGGAKNSIGGEFSTIGGGVVNQVGGIYSVIGGGNNNTVDGAQAVIAGGAFNKASSTGSTVGGGSGNHASGVYATVPGGDTNSADGLDSFAAGYHARAKYEGSFVWNDRSVTSGDDSLLSTAPNQFVVRATGGFGLNQAPTNYGIYLKQRPSGTETHHLMGIRLEFGSNTDYWDVFHDLANDINFGFNGVLKGFIDDFDGTYYKYSDASLKEDVQPFRSSLSQVLQLRPATYHFKDHPNASKRSLGLIAQEVEPYFPELVAEKDGIKTLDYSGFGVVSIKAIQELYAIVQQQQARLDRQEAELVQLRQATLR